MIPKTSEKHKKKQKKQKKTKQNHVYKEETCVVRVFILHLLKHDVTFQTRIICIQNARSPSSILIQNIV